MIPTIIISSITFISIILSLLLFPKIRIGKIQISTYWIIALVGAITLLTISFAPIKEVYQQLTVNSSINPLKILVLFFSMTLISVFLDEFGLFKYLAHLAAKNAKGNQYVLFFSLYLLTAVLTIFTSNDVVILTFTPFICFFCKRSHINPLPYLIMEFVTANTWSLMFIIGNPTNIFLGTTANIDFVSYLKVMALPTIAAGLVELLILFLLFKNKLKDQIEIDTNEEVLIKDKVLLIVGVIHLISCLMCLIISNYIHFEMWLISLIFASSLLIFVIIMSIIKKENWSVLLNGGKRLPYPLIPFFLSMFIIVVAFNYQGITLEIAKIFGDKYTIWIYGYSSFLASNIINNIPMSILYSQLCSHLSETSYLPGIYASIIGSNIGAFLTPMGALAGIMFTNLLNEHDVKFSCLDFMKYGVIISIPTITVALGVLYLMFI